MLFGTLFAALYFASLWLFCDHQFVLLPLTSFTHSLNPPVWQPSERSLCL